MPKLSKFAKICQKCSEVLKSWYGLPKVNKSGKTLTKSNEKMGKKVKKSYQRFCKVDKSWEKLPNDVKSCQRCKKMPMVTDMIAARVLINESFRAHIKVNSVQKRFPDWISFYCLDGICTLNQVLHLSSVPRLYCFNLLGYTSLGVSEVGNKTVLNMNRQTMHSVHM